MLKIDGQEQPNVDHAVSHFYKQLGNHANHYFKMIMFDNSSEFAEICEMLIGIKDVFFAHPYALNESVTKEKQHKLIRRFIPETNV